jgi:Rrf2 family transcriptional regulator, nitric oxide-sensitive transcriptional repressor
MRLTVYSDYALRLLMYLAVRNDRLATIPDVARAYSISSNHLMKVVHQMGQAGYIETVRGRNGGMRLAKPASEISVGEVIRFTEPDMDIVPCFQPENQACPLQRACRLKGALQKAQHAFLAVLDDYTIGDLTAVSAPLRTMLGIDTEPLPQLPLELAPR